MHNVLSGESAVFAIRQPNTLRTAPDYWGNLRNRWAQAFDASLIKKTHIREGMGRRVRDGSGSMLSTRRSSTGIRI